MITQPQLLEGQKCGSGVGEPSMVRQNLSAFLSVPLPVAAPAQRLPASPGSPFACTNHWLRQLRWVYPTGCDSEY